MTILIRSARLYFWPIIAVNMIAMSVCVGADLMRATLFSAVLSLLASFGFLLNDLWDRDVDRVNNPGHLEIADAKTLRAAAVLSIGFFFGGLSLAYCLGSLAFNLAVSIAAGLVAYTVVLRKHLIVPTILAAILSSSPLWSALVLWDKNTDLWKWLFVIGVVVIVAAREILMDAYDVQGDRMGSRETIATNFGQRVAKITCIALTISGSALVAVIALFQTSRLALSMKLGVAALVLSILYLIIHPALETLSDVSLRNGSTIDRYVRRSRLAMVLVSLLSLCLWRF